MTLKFKRAFEHDLQIPRRHSTGAAGYDLRNAEGPVTVYPGAVESIPTGWCVEIPQGHVGFVKDRSGMALRGITTHAGVIDNDYRGELRVLVSNVTESPIMIDMDERIAQMVLVRCATPPATEVDDLSPTGRGSSGFGSSGSR